VRGYLELSAAALAVSVRVQWALHEYWTASA
jgi:hypothetical protein